MTVDSDSIRRALSIGDNRTPYKFTGSGPSLIRDAAAAAGWSVSDVNTTDARQRLFKYAGDAVAFAELNTTTAADVVPPGYRNVALLGGADTPLASAAERADIEGPSPFVVPTVTTGGLTGDQTEGDPPTEGTLGSASEPVTPQGVSGMLPLTRELVDSASPAGDLIALSALREDYRRQVEARIYSVLNTAASGTITSGFVPSGAQASVSTGSALPADLKKALARYANVRKRRPRSVVVSGAAGEELAEALDESTGTAAAMWRVQGASVNPSVVDFGAAAGDADVVILGSDDLWVWESPATVFRYGQRSGPEIVEVNLWGYLAVRLIRPVGLSALRWTAA